MPGSISTISLPSHAAYNMALPTQHTLSTTPLTQILFTYNPHLFSLATTHPFLHAAGLGTLPKSTLSKWLSQDRLYAQSYITFIGALLSRVHIPHAFVADKSTSLRWRIANLLTSALNNIHRELAFFEDVAARYGLDLEASPGHWKDGVGSGFQASGATRQYEALFRAFGSDTSMSLLEGLVVLWATEQVYLSAWRYAAGQGRRSGYGHLTSANGEVRGSRSLSHSPPPGYNGGSNGTAAAWREKEQQRQSQAMELPSQQQQPLRSHPTTQSTQSEPRASPRPTDQSPPPQPSSADPNRSSPPRQIPHHTSASPQPPSDPFANDLDSGALRKEFIPNWTSPDFERFVQDIADVTDELAEREEAWRRVDVYKAVWEHILEVERRFWGDVN